ncbi:tRNA (adenosine(37)-N6)-threonylcarbamoyltransferase complex dimerization subunit type 1 TsaB [Candidatus Allofournierella merdavium]|uniref:tRNA (adenosine(37)-N6)-threonylcarbamoyltransferase complex dimerization subunit type 1 TsaB n=1 Tax=Candidatus Allofournierella merdavium TaxID=2838593 RepID=UPI00374EBFA1
MITFGLDSAGRTAAVALMRDEELLYEGFLAAGHTHSEVLMGLVDAAFRATGLSPADVDLWGVCAGPGSFTGLRIGLATVKGLALVHGAPCAAVSTPEALAFGCPPGEGAVLAALDARRGEVYWAAFDLERHARLVPDAAAPVKELAQFVENCKKPLFFVGDGAALCYNEYGRAPGVLPCPPALGLCRGAGVCLAARAANQRGEAVPAAALSPRYLRLSQAERERAARGQSLRP